MQFGQIDHFEQFIPEATCLTPTAPPISPKSSLEVIAPELDREPRNPDNVWCVIEAVACVVAGLIKEPVARRYYGRALDHCSRDLAPGLGEFSSM